MPPDELLTILANFPIWNTNEDVYPRDRTVLDLIGERAQAWGDRPAVRFGDESLTYQQVLARAEQIAGRLHARGVGAGDRVGLLLPRSLDLIPAMLAIWRVGAIYVPLDRAFPLQRLAAVVEDAAIETVITSRAVEPLAAGLPGVHPLLLDPPASPAAESLADVPVASALDGAYIMYTSGSTGQPTGVEIRHRSLTNVLVATQRLLRFTSADSLLALATASFDISLVELLMPLISGGVVEVGEDGLAGDGIALAARIEASRPSVVQATPSTWKAVLAAGWGGDRDVRIVSTGERLPRALAEQLLPRCQAVWNAYGPTETAIFSTAYAVVTAPDEPMRIGRPLANTQAYILDDLLQPVPIGAVGELYIGGDGLARGYWRQPELTSERFIASPFRPGERLYRTGDLARYRPDGDIVCLERIDDQVKVHGVRIELGEIEAALRSLAGVRDAAVTAWTDPHGDSQLVAHVVTDVAADAAAIRARLRERLPEAMVPPHVLFSAAFLLSPNGKVDRAALPAPEAGGTHDRRGAVPPATPTERLLAEAWASVLTIDVERIGRDDDFMDLGGHSRLMTPLLLEVRGRFHVTFTMRELFAASTLQKLAALIDGRRRERAGESNGTAAGPTRALDWGKQRMAFLLREAQLPSSIGPARGLVYRPRGEIRTMLLTGATGFIGGHILTQALRTTDVELVCLVRPKRGERARDRLERGLREYDLWRDDPGWQDAWDRRVRVVEGDVTLPRLGIEDTIYESLARELDGIIHSAAFVNFIYPYEALRTTNVLGVHEVIRLAFHRRITPVHYLSTAAIWPMGAENTFYERDPIEHGEVLNLGYDESKWVAERCLLYAAERGLPVARYRPGEVGGDSETGRCVTDHFVLATVKGFLQLGAMPELDMYLDVTPADYVAKSVVYLAMQRSSIGKVFHLTNPGRWHMRDALAFLRSLGYKFEVRPFAEIRNDLLQRPDFAQNALFPYQAMLMEMDDRSLQLPHYDCQQAVRALDGSGIVCPPVDERLLGTYLQYLLRVGFMPLPQEVAVVAGGQRS
jgi:amino acid adenylation domain-containing protein/thioester reductase-like protein